MFSVQAKGLRRRAVLIVAPPPSLMQQGGGGVEGLMEKLMISMEAPHINWTCFFVQRLMFVVRQKVEKRQQRDSLLCRLFLLSGFY